MKLKLAISSLGLFAISFVVFNGVMGVIWEIYFHEKVYNCTDSLPFGYFPPGDWVHGEVQTVAVIRNNVPMSNPDTLLEGWSIERLWQTWWLMFGGTVLASLAITCPVFMKSRQRTPNKTVNPTADRL
jgi:hypothetical protein